MTASASLFKLYKEYDSGHINSDKFVERLRSVSADTLIDTIFVYQDVGVKPTNEFSHYMRKSKGQN